MPQDPNNEKRHLKQAASSLESSENTQEERADRKPLDQLREQLEAVASLEESSLGYDGVRGLLVVSFKGRQIGQWKVEQSELVLYRPGCAAAEAHVTSVADAAKMTARLVAAQGHASPRS